MGDLAAAPPPPAPTSGPGDPPSATPATGASPVRLLEAICPYLMAADGRWRSASPTTEHRCTAVEPPAPLALAKQRRLCLGDGHRSCATFLAAEGGLPGAAPDDPLAGAPSVEWARRTSRWQYAGTTPLVLDPGPRLGALVAGPGRLGQAGLVVLVGAAFGILILARSASGPGDTAAASPASGPPVSPPASPSPSVMAPSPTPSERAPSPTPSVAASPSGSPTSASPTPGASFRTYRVQAGDTLSAIAARFGTTVKAIADLNGISNPSQIRIGQILRIP